MADDTGDLAGRIARLDARISGRVTLVASSEAREALAKARSALASAVKDGDGDGLINDGKPNEGPAPAKSAPAPANDDAPKDKADVFFEVAPDPNDSALTARWNALSAHDKFAISAEAARGVTGEVLKAVGAHGALAQQIGGYLGQTNPSLALEIDEPAKAVAAANLLGYALSQDSMMVVSDKPGPGLSPTGIVGIKLGDKGGSYADVASLYDKLWSLKDKDGNHLIGGHTTSHGEMVVLNFSDTPSDELAKLVDQHLGGKFEVYADTAYAAFPDKGSYGYAGGQANGASPLQQAADRIRSKATEYIGHRLSAAEGRFQPHAAPGDEAVGKGFNPGEARDKDGKWTLGGSISRMLGFSKPAPKAAVTSNLLASPQGKATPQYGGFWGGGGDHQVAAVRHPKTDDAGKEVWVGHPTQPSPAATWTDPKQVATFRPAQPGLPASLNGVPLAPWADHPTTHAAWNAVEGQDPSIDMLEPPLKAGPGQHVGAGVVVVEPDGRVWLCKPTNGYGGYANTFPKGTVEPDVPSLQASAIKEAFEETGLKVQLDAVLGDFKRTTSVARYYLAHRVGGTPAQMGWESQAVRLAPINTLKKLLNRSDVDHPIVDALTDELDLPVTKAFNPDQARWPAGSPLGGQWMPMDAAGLTSPPKIAWNKAGTAPGSNAQYDVKANALYGAAKAGDWATVSAAKDAYAANVPKWAAGEGSTHDKWKAQLHQYATKLLADKEGLAAAGAKADKLTGPMKLSDMKLVGSKPGGSNPGGVYYDASGQKWLVKGSNHPSDDRAREEVLASQLMAATGIPAPEIKLVDLGGAHGGGLGVAVKWIDGLKPGGLSPSSWLKSQMQDQFAVHAWLANYDAVGLDGDNVSVTGDGKVIVPDPGGSLEYRAQGLKKTTPPFGPVAAEWDSMRDPKINAASAKYFGDMTASQLANSAGHLKNITASTITSMVADAGLPTSLATTLIHRKDDILFSKAAAPAPVATPVAAAEKFGIGSDAHKVMSDLIASTDTQGGLNGLLETVGNSNFPAEAKADLSDKIEAKSLALDGMSPPKAAPVVVIGKSPSGWPKEPKVMAGDVLGTTMKPENLQKNISQISGAMVDGDVAQLLKYQTALAHSISADPSLGELKVKAYLDAATRHAQKQAQAHAASVADPGTGNPDLFGQFKTYISKTDQKSMPGILEQVAASMTLSSAEKKALVDHAMAVSAAPAAEQKFGNFTTDQLKGMGYGPSMDKFQKVIDAGDDKAATDYIFSWATAVTPTMKAVTAWAQSKFDEKWPTGAVPKPVASMSDDELLAALNKTDAPTTTVEAQPASKGATPDWSGYKTDATSGGNSSHNPKIDQIAALHAKGDVKGILGLPYSTNTYGKKQAKAANDALASLGSSEKVTPGQKQGEHPAVGGSGHSAATLATLSEATNAAAPVKNIVIKKSDLPKKPDFANYKGPGQGLSSKPWKNAQNQALVDQIETKALTGDLAGLKALTYDQLADDEAGTPTGKKIAFADAPSKYVQSYYTDTTEFLQDKLFPPKPLTPAEVFKGKALEALSQHFAPIPVGKTVDKLPENMKMGFWAVLGRAKDAVDLMPKKTQDISPSLSSKLKATKDGWSSTTSKFVSGIQANAGPSTAYRTGQQSYGGIPLKAMTAALNKDAAELPEGTKFYRWQSMSSNMVKAMKATPPGTVLDPLGSMCGSKHPTATKGFGGGGGNRIVFTALKGAKVIPSYATGGYSSEQEISTLPGQRMILTGHTANEHGGYDFNVLLLPPHPQAHQ